MRSEVSAKPGQAHLAHKLGRAAYYVLLREKPFDAAKFFAHAG
ncbi:MAG: hypothetical protein ACREI8_00190 [Myxococcota bacterium]